MLWPGVGSVWATVLHLSVFSRKTLLSGGVMCDGTVEGHFSQSASVSRSPSSSRKDW